MNRIVPALIVALVVVFPGCARRQSGPVVGDPGGQASLAGVYQFETVLNRGVETGGGGAALPERVSGTIRLVERQGSYTVEIDASNRSTMPIISGSRQRDNDLTLQARGSDGVIFTLRLTFVGGGFSGLWIEPGGASAPVRGVKRQ